jgi:16S rRNA (uracil1498-N3)-methyltransferase
MVARFYCSDLQGNSTILDESESHHALHVMRLKVGETVELFDGTGQVAQGVISGSDRHNVALELKEIQETPAPNRPRLILAAPPPRGDRFKSMIEKLTEIGVDEYIPLRTVRSVVDPRQSRLSKLRGTVISAMKQSGRNRFMEIHESREFSVVLRNATSAAQSVFIAHPGEKPTKHAEPLTRDTLLLIGPEGGFTSEEVLQATDYAAERISWPDGILRIETATILFSGTLLQRMR